MAHSFLHRLQEHVLALGTAMMEQIHLCISAIPFINKSRLIWRIRIGELPVRLGSHKSFICFYVVYAAGKAPIVTKDADCAAEFADHRTRNK